MRSAAAVASSSSPPAACSRAQGAPTPRRWRRVRPCRRRKRPRKLHTAATAGAERHSPRRTRRRAGTRRVFIPHVKRQTLVRSRACAWRRAYEHGASVAPLPGRNARHSRRGCLDDLQQAAADNDEQEEACTEGKRASAGGRGSCEACKALDEALSRRALARLRTPPDAVRAAAWRRARSRGGDAPSISGPTEKGDLGRAVLSGTLPRRSTLRWYLSVFTPAHVHAGGRHSEAARTGRTGHCRCVTACATREPWRSHALRDGQTHARRRRLLKRASRCRRVALRSARSRRASKA